MDFIIILLSLALLMYLAYKGFTVLVIAPTLAFLVAVLASGGEIPGMVALTELFMPGLAGFAKNYFLIILSGAVFGKIMGASGASASIAEFISAKLGKERAILSVVATSGLLVYGGISVFVVVFAVYPIGAALFKEVDIPKRLLPGAIALGSFTFAMTALPGTPQAINTIPITTLGTSIYAAPVLGIIGGSLMFGFGLLWFKKRVKEAQEKGEGYGDHNDSDISGYTGEKPPVMLAVLPLITIPIVALSLERIYYPMRKAHYATAMESVGSSVGASGINNLWPVLIAIITATAIAFIIFAKYAKNPKELLKSGAEGSLLPTVNTAAQVGYGAVVRQLPAFISFQGTLALMSAPALFKIAISTTLLAGIVGSSSGGTAIAFAAMGDTFKELALANNISLEVVHRISLMAAGGLDSLPHCGAVITLLSATGLTHKESYKDIAVCTIAIPLVSVFITILIAMLGVV